MKIIRRNSEQLIVGENPIWVAVLLVVMGLIFTAISMGLVMSGELFGLFFLIGAAMPFGFLFIFVRRVQLIFNAADGTLTVQRKNLMRGSTVVHSLDEVERAEIETSTSDKSTTYRVIMVYTGQSAGRRPITLAYSNVGDHKGVSKAINEWLRAYRAENAVNADNLP